MVDKVVRLLVSDDTEGFGRVFAERAHHLGWECVISADMASFIAGLQSDQFDLVCLQMVHPEIDGLGAMQILGGVGYVGKVLIFNHSTDLYSRIADQLSDAFSFTLSNYRWPLSGENVEEILLQTIDRAPGNR